METYDPRQPANPNEEKFGPQVVPAPKPPADPPPIVGSYRTSVDGNAVGGAGGSNHPIQGGPDRRAIYDRLGDPQFDPERRVPRPHPDTPSSEPPQHGQGSGAQPPRYVVGSAPEQNAGRIEPQNVGRVEFNDPYARALPAIPHPSPAQSNPNKPETSHGTLLRSEYRIGDKVQVGPIAGHVTGFLWRGGNLEIEVSWIPDGQNRTVRVQEWRVKMRIYGE